MTSTRPARRRGLPRRRRKDSRTTAYELTIRVPEEYRTYFDGKKKLTRTVFALSRKDIPKNVAKAKFLTHVFKKSKPLIDPLMADDAARFLQEVEKLPLCYLKVTLLLLLNTGMQPEEMLAIRAGNIVFDGNETIISITGALDRDGKTVKDHPKSDAGRRSVPVDDYIADTARAWFNGRVSASQDASEVGARETRGREIPSSEPLFLKPGKLFSLLDFSKNPDISSALPVFSRNARPSHIARGPSGLPMRATAEGGA